MKVNRSFWRGRRVFLTGHTGFKGSWLSLWLNALGADVTGYALDPPTRPSLFEQANVAEKVRSLHGDIRDFGRLKGAMVECRPEVVLHLAAQSVVRTSYEDPIGNYSSNVMGTVHVLEAVRQLSLPCAFVNVTSDKCYENREWIWGYRENEPMGGHDPYSNSKGCAELVTTAYRDSFFQPENIREHGVALGSARAGNAIGGGDWTSHQLIPDLMRGFLDSQPCLIRNPSAWRPWQFVLEPLRGYLVSPSASPKMVRASPPAGTSARSTPTSSRFPGLPMSWFASGATALPGPSIPQPIRTKPTPSNWTHPKPPPASTGVRCSRFSRRLHGLQTGTRPFARESICSNSPCSRSSNMRP